MSAPYNQTLAPCGTKAARRRHQRRDEECANCAPKTLPLQPCGTRAAWRRHRRNKETPCGPCNEAIRAYNDTRPRTPDALRVYTVTPLPELLEEILFLLNAGEGTARILAATGYTGREKTFRARLVKAGHQNLANRILNPWELAA